eukprot:SAG31_NODE_1001_length_10455_cov_12.021727_4_plen_136_part_00
MRAGAGRSRAGGCAPRLSARAQSSGPVRSDLVMSAAKRPAPDEVPGDSTASAAHCGNGPDLLSAAPAATGWRWFPTGTLDWLAALLLLGYLSWACWVDCYNLVSRSSWLQSEDETSGWVSGVHPPLCHLDPLYRQ